MNKIRQRTISTTLAVVLSLVLGWASQVSAKPLQVFILAGQSNMQGHANISTFGSMADDPKTAPLLKEMIDADGNPHVCKQVWVASLGCGGNQYSDMLEKTGNLTTGFGASTNEIGPEFTFGIYMEKLIHEPILIIKASWGGRSLHTDFRPPSAGPEPINDYTLSQWKARGLNAEQESAKIHANDGVFYHAMIDYVRKVLGDIKRVAPDYNPKQGYRLAGFVWFQGFNDMIDSWAYPDNMKPGGYDEYSVLLEDFIRDVRKDLAAPKMPFVIGVMGIGGEAEGAKPPQMYFRQAEAAPASLPEFKGNVAAVQTAPFWVYAMAAAQPKQARYNQILDTAHALTKDGAIDTASKWEGFWKPIGAPLPQDRIWRFISIDPQADKDKLHEYTDRRFRDITLPAGLEQWYMPGFDDSHWMQGKAPIGKGVWKAGGITLDKYPSAWGEGEFLLMRTTFEVNDLNYAAYRLAILARQGFDVYLNGHKINTYIWWNDAPYYRAIVLGNDETQDLKKGKNVLAAYANDQYSKGSTAHYGATDLWLEGITQPDKERLDRALEDVLSLKDREILKGVSNGDYHYMGAARIMAPIGKSFAEAMAGLIR